MWLLFDIGNSAVKGGLYDGSQIRHTFRLDASTSQASWETTLLRHLRQGAPITRVGLASVVPSLTERIEALVEHQLALPVETLSHRMRLPFELAYRTPHTLGTDRLAAAAGAWVRYGLQTEAPPRSVIAIDAGSAVTCDLVDRAGVFRGGSIGVGPGLVRDALHTGTAQLPPVRLEMPSSPIGRSTEEALQAGIMYAFVDSVQGILTRIRDTHDERPVVILTGGWADLLKDHLHPIDVLDPHLVLYGCAALMTLNAR